MDERINQVATLANAVLYDSEATRKYIDGAPHLKHSTLRNLYGQLVVSVYDFAAAHTPVPKVLDLGAGEGSVTLPFLELGATVTAVDISESQLKALQAKCMHYAGKLEVSCQDVFAAIKAFQLKGGEYDIVVANSFLHHIPDYLALIRQAVTILPSHGQFFSFQEPLRYDSVGRLTMIFNTLAYGSWRIFKGDIIEGVKRRIRRSRGIYLDECLADNVEYHAVRNGVDQDAIDKLFQELGFEYEIVRYFSTQSPLWQFIGTALNVQNTFAVSARKTVAS